MEKLTKKQHREIITNLINENHNVKDLRNIQQVTEIFKEDAELRKEGSVLVAADAIRLLMDKLDDTQLRHVYFFIRGMLGLK